MKLAPPPSERMGQFRRSANSKIGLPARYLLHLRAALGKRLQQLANSFLQQRDLYVRRDFRQRFQHKPPFGHRRMRHRQRWRVDVGRAEQQDVDVDDARALGLRSLPSHGALDIQDAGKEFSRDQFRPHGHGTIQEPWLLGKFDRLGLIERRNFLYIAEVEELANRGPDVYLPVSEVGTQREIDDLLHVAMVTREQAGQENCEGSMYTPLPCHL